MANLRDLLSERGISLWAVISRSPATEKTAQLLGLATRISKPRPEDLQHATKQTLLDDAALWLNRTIRSGTRTEFHGHIAVLGDVNHGAEIVADGSIIIWGRLRGVIHAGAQGDQKASVCALDFAPTQLRIAGEIAGLPLKVDQKQPSKAILQDGHIIVIPWKSGQQ
jgi:septum site-determining protein MinC